MGYSGCSRATTARFPTSLAAKRLSIGIKVFVRKRHVGVRGHHISHLDAVALFFPNPVSGQSVTRPDNLCWSTTGQSAQAVIAHQAHRIGDGGVHVDIDRQMNHHVAGLDPAQHDRLELIGVKRRIQAAVDLRREDGFLPERINAVTTANIAGASKP